MNYEKIVEEAFSTLNVYQFKNELLDCAKFLSTLNLKNVLEIGTQYGGTFYVWCSLASGIKISVDLSYGPFGGIINDRITERDSLFHEKFKDIYFISGDSQDKTTSTLVKKILNNNMLDFLFIDADHTYEGVKADYERYKELVKPGGYIGFHEINKAPEGMDCQVNKFWEELQGDKIEFNKHQIRECMTNITGGIGLIKV